MLCTFGAGLIPLVFIAYLIGSLLHAFAAFIFMLVKASKPKEVTTKEGQEHHMVYFIIKARESGMPDSHITEVLLNKGWNNEEIELGFRKA